MMETIVGVLLVSLLVFLLCREFWCWYFKINRRYELAREQLGELSRIRKLLEDAEARASRAAGEAKPEVGRYRRESAAAKAEATEQTSKSAVEQRADLVRRIEAESDPEGKR